jgi:hypothetical protein
MNKTQGGRNDRRDQRHSTTRAERASVSVLPLTIRSEHDDIVVLHCTFFQLALRRTIAVVRAQLVWLENK